MTLFRVFQQSMMNIVRHAEASEVQVRFTLDAEEARLEVTDNGKGFDVPPNWIKFACRDTMYWRGRRKGYLLWWFTDCQSEPLNRTIVSAIIPWSGSPT